MPQHCELCPRCMHSMRAKSCSFCGTLIASDEVFCPECGNARGGVKCPRCGTINSRGFCYHCGAPLSLNAIAEIKKAHADPKYKRLVALAQEVASLEEELGVAAPEAEAPAPSVVEAVEVDTLEVYEPLPEVLEEMKILESEPILDASQQEDVKRNVESFKTMTREAKKKVYKEKIAQMQDIMNEFAPDPTALPEIQRDYYSARQVKVKTLSKSTVKTGWVCNFCGCFHPGGPDECCEPWQGGTWQYEEKIVETETWITEN